MKKNIKFLLVYGVVIVIALACILFVIPDSFFGAKYEKNYKKYFGENTQTNNNENKVEFTDYEKQKKALLNGNYTYQYTILDSMGTKTYHFECKGTVTKDKENGSCTYPDTVSYTKESKSTVFNEIGTTYIDLKTIFNLIKDVKPSLTQQEKTRKYTYKIKIKDLDTEVIIITSTKEITQISINNQFMTYLLKYETVKVDN